MEIKMPNWVYNALHCNGSKDDLDTLAAFFEMDVEVHSWNPQKGLDDLVIENVPFTYMAMRNPFEEPHNITREEYHSVNGYSDGKQTGKTPGNWYNWNVNHWGVKWDAKFNAVQREDELLSYHFESPWGPPSADMLLDMSEKFPNVVFTHNYEEEQGWGGEYEFQNGEVSEEREWDEPASHSDQIERGNSCMCEDGDLDWMYDDCPEKIAAEEKELQNS
jgi:hypothetical protein